MTAGATRHGLPPDRSKDGALEILAFSLLQDELHGVLALQSVQADVLFFFERFGGFLERGEVGRERAVGIQPDVPTLVGGAVLALIGAPFQADGIPQFGGTGGVAAFVLADDAAGAQAQARLADLREVLADGPSLVVEPGGNAILCSHRWCGSARSTGCRSGMVCPTTLIRPLGTFSRARGRRITDVVIDGDATPDVGGERGVGRCLQRPLSPKIRRSTVL